MFSRLPLLTSFQEMEQERIAREKEEQERKVKEQKIKEEFGEANSQWERDKLDMQDLIAEQRAAEDLAKAKHDGLAEDVDAPVKGAGAAAKAAGAAKGANGAADDDEAAIKGGKGEKIHKAGV